MARFDVCRPGSDDDYLLDVQTGLPGRRNTRVVVPLLLPANTPQPAIRLNPIHRMRLLLHRTGCFQASEAKTRFSYRSLTVDPRKGSGKDRLRSLAFNSGVQTTSPSFSSTGYAGLGGTLMGIASHNALSEQVATSPIRAGRPASSVSQASKPAAASSALVQ